MLTKNIKCCKILKVNKILSRVDERFGFMTPQQPISLGANTDKEHEKVSLNDD